MPRRSHQGYDVFKRVLDVVGATVLLLVFSPVILLTALAVLLVDGSPVLFTQTRPGRDGTPFRLLKFRTMRAAREGEAELASDSVRLTRLGRVLRATSLDELPQLLNVLRGDMSFVGPRPLLMQYLPRYSPEQARRHEVRPGITGLAQVSGRNALSWEDRLALDVEYVDSRSLSLDLSILVRTFTTVFARKGISAEDHATMPEFMGTRSEPRDQEEEG